MLGGPGLGKLPPGSPLLGQARPPRPGAEPRESPALPAARLTPVTTPFTSLCPSKGKSRATAVPLVVILADVWL